MKRSEQGNRPIISAEQIDDAIDKIITAAGERLHEKGHGAWTSRHEILGIVSEEFRELENAVHREDDQRIVEELKDIAVGAIFSIACINAGTLDW